MLLSPFLFALSSSTRNDATAIVLYDECDLGIYYSFDIKQGAHNSSHGHHTRDERATALPSSASLVSESATLSDDDKRHIALLGHASASAFGTLHPGGPVDLFSRNFIGLLLNWFLIGFADVMLTGLATIMSLSYIGYTDYQATAASAIFNLPRLFKFVAGYLTDCVPINRRRRKPYTIIGWAVIMVLMYALASVHLPAPHLRGPNELPDPHGGAFVTVIVLAKFGHLVALVSLEGVMIECAQREGERVRGRVQCVYFIARFAGCPVAQLAMALAFNNPEFVGTFAVAVPIRVVFAFQSLVAGVGIAITVWWINEDPIITSTQRFSTQMRHIWHIMQQPTTWRIAVLGFVEKLGTTYEIRESNSVAYVWLHVTRIQVQILSVVFVTCDILTAVLYLAWLTNSNWRRTLVWSVGVGLVAMIPIETLTTFDVYRNFTIFAIKDYIVSCCNSMLLLTLFILVVEVVDPGYEAVTYGLLTTVYNLGETVTAVATSILTAHSDPVFEDLTLDTPAVRWHVMFEYLGRYGILIVTMIVVLPFMPRQKRHLREIAERGNPTIVIPIVLFVVLGVLFSLSLASTLLAVNESMSCLPFAGGKGCH